MARVGHLATADGDGRPHCVPVVFVLWGDDIVIPIDRKPKRVAPERLARVRNLQANPAAAFVVDRYDEDWSRLQFVMAHGHGRFERELPAALVRAFADKYEQYKIMPIDGVIRLAVERWSGWSGAAAAD